MKEALKKVVEMLILLLFAGSVVYGVASIFNEGVVTGLAVLVADALAIPTVIKVFKDIIAVSKSE